MKSLLVYAAWQLEPPQPYIPTRPFGPCLKLPNSTTAEVRRTLKAVAFLDKYMTLWLFALSIRTVYHGNPLLLPWLRRGIGVDNARFTGRSIDCRHQNQLRLHTVLYTCPRTTCILTVCKVTGSSELLLDFLCEGNTRRPQRCSGAFRYLGHHDTTSNAPVSQRGGWGYNFM